MISFYKISLLLAVPAVAGKATGTELLCLFFLLKLVWTFYFFDWVVLIGWGLLLICKRVVYIYCCCLSLSTLVIDFRSEEIFAK